MVPRQHGVWLAANVPGAEARIDDAHGHLTLAEHLVARGSHLAAVTQLNVAFNATLRKGILAAADSKRVQSLVRRTRHAAGRGEVRRR